jgi:hypothetical protein
MSGQAIAPRIPITKECSPAKVGQYGPRNRDSPPKSRSSRERGEISNAESPLLKLIKPGQKQISLNRIECSASDFSYYAGYCDLQPRLLKEQLARLRTRDSRIARRDLLSMRPGETDACQRVSR